MSHHPWRAFRALTHFTLQHAVLPDGILGCTNFDTGVVTLALGIDQAERRCTIAHETEHIRRGWSPCTAREECSIDRVVARRLIDIRDLGEALAWARCEDEAADELWVDVHMLRARMNGLHPSERGYLVRRLENPVDHESTSGGTS